MQAPNLRNSGAIMKPFVDKCAQAAQLILALTLMSAGPELRAQAFPSGPLKFLVPYAAGGSTDIIARTLADPMAAKLGQQVVVVNQPGAGGGVGSAAVARAPADGLTLLLATNGSHAINPSLYPSLAYDPVKDFQAVSMVASVPLLLVVPSASDIKAMRDLVEKKRPMSFGSAGVGSSGHLTGEMLKLEGHLDANHIAYRGDGPNVLDLIGGRIHFSFVNMPAATNHVKSGMLRPLAVTTAQRSAQLPGVPTVSEAGYPRLQVDPWYGVFVAAATPHEVVARLNQVINASLQEPGVRKRLEDLGATTLGTTPDAFAKALAADIAKFAVVVKASGAKPE
jgi:tripartite-type tricarboxylate transporter receptor subunit TctC